VLGVQVAMILFFFQQTLCKWKRKLHDHCAGALRCTSRRCLTFKLGHGLAGAQQGTAGARYCLGRVVLRHNIAGHKISGT